MPFTESDPVAAEGGGRRSRKRRRSRGLGRGLSRILNDAAGEGGPDGSKRAGLLQLVGGPANPAADRIRDFVVDAALGAMVDGFGLDGVVLAARSTDGSNPAEDATAASSDAAGEPTFLATRLPASLSADSRVLFEMYGQLWRLLSNGGTEVASDLVGQRLDGPVSPVEHCQVGVGRHWFWLCRVEGAEDPVGAVAIRKASFAAEEAESLAALVAAVVSACDDRRAGAALRAHIRSGTSTLLKDEGEEVRAEVTADWELPDAQDDRRHPTAGRLVGAGRAGEPVLAVARAAAKACRPRCEVVFAGASPLETSGSVSSAQGVDDSVDGGLDGVSIVLLTHPDRGLRLGFAVGRDGDLGSVAEAVFTAALD